MNKNQEMQSIMRLYKDETGEKEIDMHKIAKYAASRGWPLPKPVSTLDLLAKQFTQAARQEIRRDTKTGRPYRANHAFTTSNRSLFTPGRNVLCAFCYNTFRASDLLNIV